MQKSFISILIGLLIFGAGGKAWAGSVVAADLNCTNPAGCVQTNEISDGAVTGAKIADGTVTDAKINGPISTGKLEKPANLVVVAKSGGDFSSISAALAAINPTVVNPYIIKIMPGTYTESVTMKSYVHLEGAGRDVATIAVPNNAEYGISLANLTNTEVSGLKVIGFPTCCRYSLTLIKVVDSAYVKINNNYIDGGGEDSETGISITGTSSNVVISDNFVTKMNGAGSWGIIASAQFSAYIYNNIVTGNNGGIYLTNGKAVNNAINNNEMGITVYGANAVLSDSYVTGNQYDGVMAGNFAAKSTPNRAPIPI